MTTTEKTMATQKVDNRFLLTTTIKNKLEAFQLFCTSLRNPVFTENKHILVAVKVVCYEDYRTPQLHWGEVLLVTHGYGFGNIRMSDGEEELFNEGVYNLLESADCEYSIGRTTATLVIETPSLDKIGIHRIDLIEDVKQRYVL